MDKGPSPPKPGAPPGAASRPKRRSRSVLIIVVAVVLAVAIVAPVLVLSYGEMSSIYVSVKNKSDKMVIFTVTKDGSESFGGAVSLHGAARWDRDCSVSAGKYNITVHYSYAGSEDLQTSRTVDVGIAATVFASFELVSPKATSTPQAALNRTAVEFGEKVTIVSVDQELAWDDVMIVLGQSRYAGTWIPTSAGLTSAPGPAVQSLGSRILGSSTTIWCNVTDVAGNGLADAGDHFTLSWSSMYPPMTAMLWNVELMFAPNGEPIGTITFTPLP